MNASCIETSRLILRPWKDVDAETLYRYARHPEVGPAAGWPPHASVEDSLGIIRTVFAAPETYAIVLKETNEPIGCCGVIFADGRNPDMRNGGKAELGYWTGVPYWGRGFAPEAVIALVRRCFGELGLSEVWISCYEANAKSRRVAEKCGFTYHHTEYDKSAIFGDMRNVHFFVRRRDVFPLMDVRRVTEGKRRFMPLLLVGDEQEDMVGRYLDAGELYVGSVSGEDMAVCVVVAGERGMAEIKNIAVVEPYRRKGYGVFMVRWICGQYDGYVLTAGTGEVPSTMGFYTACGFSFSHRLTDFFTDNYCHEIIEDGIVLRDMVFFRKDTAIRRITDRERWHELLSVWEPAVRGSHDFLSEEDVAFFRHAIVEQYLPGLEVFGMEREPGRLSGFVALSDGMIEMLFVHPAVQGRGIGTRLLDFAVVEKGMRRVDVNEQNGKAFGFYRNKGFDVIGRDSTDSSGRPFPILHLELAGAAG